MWGQQVLSTAHVGTAALGCPSSEARPAFDNSCRRVFEHHPSFALLRSDPILCGGTHGFRASRLPQLEFPVNPVCTSRTQAVTVASNCPRLARPAVSSARADVRGSRSPAFPHVAPKSGFDHSSVTAYIPIHLVTIRHRRACPISSSSQDSPVRRAESLWKREPSRAYLPRHYWGNNIWCFALDMHNRRE